MALPHTLFVFWLDALPDLTFIPGFVGARLSFIFPPAHSFNLNLNFGELSK